MEKIAIASSDGINIDQHFGHTEYFYIYEISDDGVVTHHETRSLPSGELDGQNRLEAAAELLSDVTYVLCAQIGPHATRALAEHNITGYALPGKTEEALRNYIKRRGIAKKLAVCLGSSAASVGIACGGCASGGCGSF
jgi:nitrogen fixation protein NifB